MKSFRAVALRLIFPLEVRGAAVDFLGTDVAGFFETDAFDEVFGEAIFDEVLLDDDTLELEPCEPLPFEASSPKGSSRRIAIRSEHVRLRMDAIIHAG
jgi:hypothetical protein